MRCNFCNIDNSKNYNHIILETDNFVVIPSIGSLVDGYLLIVSKIHVNSMNELSYDTKIEYLQLIDRCRELFKNKYGIYPIIFEHGTSVFKNSASSIVHAHTHVVNHNFLNEYEIIINEKFHRINSIFDIDSKKNYIYYKNEYAIDYVSYDFKPISQLMRILIAKDLKLDNKYNWKNYTFNSNIEKTINKFIK